MYYWKHYRRTCFFFIIVDIFIFVFFFNLMRSASHPLCDPSQNATTRKMVLPRKHWIGGVWLQKMWWISCQYYICARESKYFEANKVLAFEFKWCEAHSYSVKHSKMVLPRKKWIGGVRLQNMWWCFFQYYICDRESKSFVANKVVAF